MASVQSFRVVRAAFIVVLVVLVLYWGGVLLRAAVEARKGLGASERLSGPEGPFGGSPWLHIQYDPAYSAPFETDYCRFLPVACSGFALEP